MTNVVTNRQFAQENLEMSSFAPKFPDLKFYEKLILSQSGSRVALLTAACDLLEIARRAQGMGISNVNA